MDQPVRARSLLPRGITRSKIRIWGLIAAITSRTTISEEPAAKRATVIQRTVLEMISKTLLA